MHILVMNETNKKARCTPIVSSLFSCRSEKCKKLPGGTTTHALEDENCVSVSCTFCYQAWVVCIACQRRFNANKMYLANKHFDEVHNSERKVTSNASVSTDIDFSMEPTNTNEYPDINEIVDLCLSESSMELTSRNFFQKKAISLPYAIQNLVGQTFSQSLSTSTLPTLSESTFHLRLANFLSKISSPLHYELIRLLNDARDLEFTSTRLPTVPNDVLRLYTKNRFSLYNQLPSPTCHVSEFHAFVHLRSVIEHYIGFGYHTDDTNSNEAHSPSATILQCPEVHAMQQSTMSSLDDATKVSSIILYLMIWSDDFEPSSNVMNKHSTWMRTVTICANKGFGVSTEHTYVLSLGFKKDAHDEMNDMFVKELEDLSLGKWMYSGKYKSRVFVIPKVLVMSADRPERNGLTHLLGHNGLTTRRWRFTGFINQGKLPSCKMCCMKRLSRYMRLKNYNACTNIGSCHHCCDWNYSTESRFLQFDLPEKYPRQQHPTSPNPPVFREVLNINYLKPVEQSFAWLQQGCRFCFHNVYYQVWNLGTSDEYVRCLGLSQSFNRKYIVEKANELFAKNPNHPNPSSTMMFPPLWNVNTELDRFIDIPMHLLFLGIIKSTIDWTFEWLKLHKVLTSFGNKVDSYHMQIKQLQCSFCKLELFKNGQEIGTSGWRAENYLALTRIMTFTFSFIKDLIPNRDEYKHEIISFELLHHTCLCMVARLMTPHSVSRLEIEDYIKVFLTVLDLGERLTFTDSSNGMFWFQRSNFLCLLNLPKQIERFGSVRKYWEGSRERYIQYIKPLMKSTRETASYLKIQLEKLNKSQLLDSLYKEVNVEDDMSRYSRFKPIVVYDNFEHLESIVRNGGPLSLLKESQFNTDVVYAVVKGNDSITLHEVMFNDRKGQYIDFFFYASIAINGNVHGLYRSMKDINYDVMRPCLGIARDITEYNCLFKYYACFSNDWVYRKKGGKFVLPSLNSTIEQYINTYL